MAKISLSKPTAGYNLAAINDNFTKLEQEFQNKVLYRNNPVGEPNTMEVAIDMNGNDILNVGDINVLGNLTANGMNIAGLNSALVWRGDWSSIVTYNVSDGVAYNGSSYICLVSHTNDPPPSANWDVLAEKGVAGAGSGDVSGPASSVNNHIAVFDGVTGKLIKDGGVVVADLVADSDIGVTVQAYDVDTAKLDVAQTWVAIQRTNETTDNDGSFDLNAALDFKCTPTGAFTLTFTNIPASPLVQKGTVILVNTGGYTASAHANTKVGSSLLTSITTAGTYELAYRTSNGVVYVTASGALA